MEQLYHTTNRLSMETQQCFEKLEKTSGTQTEELLVEIQLKISEIDRNCEKLDTWPYKLPLTRRQATKLKVDNLKYDNQHMKAALRIFQSRLREREREMQEREELMSRRWERETTVKDKETTILIDHSLQHNMSLQNANRGVDDMLRSGSGILDGLRDQRTRLKGTQRRMLDLVNVLGLSDATMRLIERRASQDKFILIGGMAATLIIILLCLVYLR
ncbi:Golgi SNAP receptor complex member 2 [Ischnura elegans]|uniref:Golgi SNAP receptor complex member 2 n=1 Tax=Ischnura elegans TaxID=197161 RepID=UPI001ED86C4F|nr:Golgi SNAP receptor complex member 2 [Ischnura elegans]